MNIGWVDMYRQYDCIVGLLMGINYIMIIASSNMFFATGSKTVRVVVLILGSCGGVGWVGVGWDVNVHCDCNHIVRSLALPHIRHATLLHVLLRFHTHVMLRYIIFTCTSCYATWSSLALHATLDDLSLALHATLDDLHLGGGVGGVGWDV